MHQWIFSGSQKEKFKSGCFYIFYFKDFPIDHADEILLVKRGSTIIWADWCLLMNLAVWMHLFNGEVNIRPI
jgi:hypothetical protein